MVESTGISSEGTRPAAITRTCQNSFDFWRDLFSAIRRLYFSHNWLWNRTCQASAFLAHHPSIQVLSFRECEGISDREIAPVSTLPKLTVLICYREDTLLDGKEDTKVITDDGLKYFAERAEMKYLNLMGKTFQMQGFNT